MAHHDWQLFTRGGDSKLTGGLPLASAKVVVRHLGVDTAMVETPYTSDAFTRTGPGMGVVLYRDGVQVFSGVVGSEQSVGWDRESGRATVKVAALGDDIHLADRLVFPDPARAGHEQTTADEWAYTGPASTAMWELIRQQVGPGALAERRHGAYYMGADPVVGTNRRWAATFASVEETLERISALSTPSPGVRVVSTADGLRVDIYAPRDVSGDVRFSADLSNLHGFTYSEHAPALTYALVAGQGEKRNRLRRAATNGAATDLRWGRRIERYIDRRDEADAAKLQTYADDEVTENVGQVNLACTLSDSEAATFLDEWNLGDRVTVYVGLPGQAKAATVVDTVREILLEVDGDGSETVRPAIGGADSKAIAPTPTQAAVAALRRNLETFYAGK